MPTKKTPTLPEPTPIAGYRRPAQYTWREFTPPDMEEGADPLRVRVRLNLSFDELDAIPTAEGTTFSDQWAVIAPHVVEWNVVRETDAGELEPVPPPAEAGPEAFRLLSMIENLWLVQTIKWGYAIRSDAEGKASTPSEPTPAV